MNILYLDDYINFYSKNNNKIYKIIPYKNTLKYGKIINKDKFIKKMIKEFNKIGVKNSIFNSTIKIIINNSYTYEDKELLKIVMEELNYKYIDFIHDSNYLNINKNNIYINCNYSYYNIMYIDIYGNIEFNTYKNDIVNKNIFINIINYFINKNIIIYGKNSNEFISILNDNNIDFYVYEEKDNLIMKKILIDNNKV